MRILTRNQLYRLVESEIPLVAWEENVEVHEQSGEVTAICHNSHDLKLLTKIKEKYDIENLGLKLQKD